MKNSINKDLSKLSKEELEAKYCNVNRYSDDLLGNMLTLGHNQVFDSVIGKCNSLRTGIDYITTPNFPINLLGKEKLTKHDINSIPKAKLDITNYWSAVGLIVYGKIKSSNKLQTLLKEEKREIASYIVTKRTFMGEDIYIFNVNSKLYSYCRLLNEFKRLVQEDNLTDEAVMDVVTSFKKDPSVGVFHGCAVNIGI